MNNHSPVTMLAARHLAVPGVLTLIGFLSYTSQYLFTQIEPAPLTRRESITFNILIAALLLCYVRACLTDPGRVPHAPRSTQLHERQQDHDALKKKHDASRGARWCRTCRASKPSRAHHCRVCKRCVPKMDHHCPWTVNCVSYRTFPHFLRFLFYCVLALTQLMYLLQPRVGHLWNNRKLPAYLGPSVIQLAHLFLLSVVGGMTLFALFILFVRTLYSLAMNTTTIESWEIERHATLRKRARHYGGWLPAPQGRRVRIPSVEFPYDVGIMSNIVLGMCTANPLSWIWPFAVTPHVTDAIRDAGVSWSENDLNGIPEGKSIMWPPPDPDRIARFTGPGPRNGKANGDRDGFTYSNDSVAAFRARQDADHARLRKRATFLQRLEHEEQRDPGGMPGGRSRIGRNDKGKGKAQDTRKETAAASGSSMPENWHGGFVESGSDAESPHSRQGVIAESDSDEHSAMFLSPSLDQDRGDGYGAKKAEVEGEESWRNADGDRLQDFGLDEDVEFYDEQDDESDDDYIYDDDDGGDGREQDEDVDGDDNVPLGELLRRKARERERNKAQ